MSLVVEVAASMPPDVEVLGLPVVVAGSEPSLPEGLVGWGGPDGAVGALGLDGVSVAALAARHGFAAKIGQSLVLRSPAGSADVAVVLLGLGPLDAVDAEAWRRAAAAFVRAVPTAGVVALALPSPLPGTGAPATRVAAVGAALAEGAILGTYRFDAYRSAPPPRGIGTLVVVPAVPGSGADEAGADEAGAELVEGIGRGRRRAGAVVFARDLINCPPSHLPPRVLADRVAERLSGVDGVQVEIWDHDRITAERLGGLLGVSRGSAEPPRLVRATYEPSSQRLPGGPDGRRAHVVLVGKGITFDSGGLSLKTADGMTTMKTDMSGAAIVLAVLSACADLEVPVRVTALAAMAENMPGGRALKPGDVLTIRNGATIEVLNTDAEGRLVLADALSLAAEIDPVPDAVIDVATLTGAATVALGTGIGALFGNDQLLVDRIVQAGARAGERLWPMPLPEDYADHIDSDVADMKNTGRAGQAGAIAAALLLARFTDTVPWAHLDIAGPARSAEAAGYVSKGGTAFGVRTLLSLLESYGTSPTDPAPAG
ncbi:MAG: leucyl aminopeptidase [Acidimicrobiales bacterium]